jgi:hypothetical protein
MPDVPSTAAATHTVASCTQRLDGGWCSQTAASLTDAWVCCGQAEHRLIKMEACDGQLMSELSRPGHDLRRIPPAYAKAHCGGYNVGGDLTQVSMGNLLIKPPNASNHNS